MGNINCYIQHWLDGNALLTELHEFRSISKWNSGTNGYIDPAIVRTVYFDNIKGTGVTSTPDPEPATEAPIPTTPDGTVYAIYNDTNGYTTNFPFQYSLVIEINLSVSRTNNAFKVN